MRKMYDKIKKSILADTVERGGTANDSAAEQYYRDLADALHIEQFPMISVNTIEKKTYIIESDKQYFLVFDHYLMEIMHLFNKLILEDGHTDTLEPFFYKMVSEECYIENHISSAVKFAGKYMDRLDDVMEHYREENFIGKSADYLFVQQAFIIAHEIFHFYVHKNPGQEIKGLVSKEQFLQKIYCYVYERNPKTAFLMSDIVRDKKMAEECLCDSTAVIQAVDAGNKIGKLSAVESGIAIAVSLMNQYIISVIHDTVKFSGDMTYERIQNLFNFRLLHLKEFISLYIKEFASEEKQKQYHTQVEEIHRQWLDKIYRPVMFMLADCNSLLKNDSDQFAGNSEERKRAKKSLMKIYKF